MNELEQFDFIRSTIQELLAGQANKNAPIDQELESAFSHCVYILEDLKEYYEYYEYIVERQQKINKGKS